MALHALAAEQDRNRSSCKAWLPLAGLNALDSNIDLLEAHCAHLRRLVHRRAASARYPHVPHSVFGAFKALRAPKPCLVESTAPGPDPPSLYIFPKRWKPKPAGTGYENARV